VPAPAPPRCAASPLVAPAGTGRNILRMGTSFPRRALERLGALALRLSGWRVDGAPPDVPTLVIIVAPHTSNWDFAVGLACGYGARILSRWPYGFFVKSTLFRGPVGAILRALGGIPIDRTAPHEAVSRSVELLQWRDRYLLVITPEGTRRRTDRWRSGFYHIALGAGVPVVPVSFDYAKRVCGIGPAVRLTGDRTRDLDLFRAFYAGVTARHPARAGPIRLRGEEAVG
jgi:1-acyl-sn-glycerol-3-phosphate acyltransferase